LVYDLDRAIEIFKPVPVGDARNSGQNVAFLRQFAAQYRGFAFHVALPPRHSMSSV
jgi:hypothetical protein